MRGLRNRKHEKFAQEIAAGTDGREAYVIAGYTPNRANHHKLSKHPKVAARIAELKEEREYAACAARVTSSQVLSTLAAHGLDRTADFFERDVAGVLRVRDLRMLPIEVAIALLRFLREGLGLANGPF
jgi:phage terminase small subunit